MSKNLDDLSDGFKVKIFELLARLVERNVHVLILETKRTKEQQEINIKKGVSWTMDSRHLPDANGKSNAIDLVPYETFQLHGPDKLLWDANNPVWQIIGEEAKRLGLIWGGDWKQKDMGHVENPRK